MVTINLSAGSDSLARIKTIKSHKNFVNIPSRSLAKEDREALNAVFPMVFGGRELKPEDCVMTVQFDDNGMFKRSYPLSISQSEDGKLVTRLGQEIVELAPNDDIEFMVKGVTLDKYEDPCMVFYTEIDDEFVELPLVLRLDRNKADKVRDKEGNINYLQLTKLASNAEKLAPLLMVAKEYSGSTNNDMVELSSLPEYQDIKVVKCRSVNASYGKSYILTVLDPDGNEVDLWAPYAIKEFFSVGAEVGENTVFQYYSYEASNGKTRYNVNIEALDWPEDESTANLDMSLFA